MPLIDRTKVLEFEARLRRAQADATLALAGGGGDSFPDQASHAGEYLTTDGSAVSWGAPAAAAGTVMEADYNAQTILAATSDDTPAALTVGEQTIVGRKTGGNIAALTAAEVLTILGLEPGIGDAVTVDLGTTMADSITIDFGTSI